MTLRLPNDIESYNQYRRFVRLIGDEVKAGYVVLRLWAELGFQSRNHGKSGLFERSETEVFLWSLKLEHPEDAFELLIRSKLLLPNSDGWICPIFAESNPECDRDYIAPGIMTGIKAAYGRRRDAIERRSPGIAQQLEPMAWQEEDGSLVTPEEMNRRVVLIKMLDSIVEGFERKPKDFEVGLVHAAGRACKGYAPHKLDLILRRIHLMVRRTPTLPRKTADVLREWDEVVAMVAPEEGFINWTRNQEHENNPD